MVSAETRREERVMDSVLIVGAGVAGPALAIALRRAGIGAVVYEAVPSPRDDAGVFLNLAPNGLGVLSALGLDDLVNRLGFQNDRLVFQNEAGRVLAEMPVGGRTVMRGALSRALREAAEKAGVMFEFGKALESIEERGGMVVARFADGTEASGFCAVGADGIHSRARCSVFPDAPKPGYTGIINLGGVVRTDLPPTGRAMRMIFGRRGFFGYAVRPSGETYWFSNFVQKDEPERSSLVPVSADRVRRQLLSIHRDDPPEVTHILNAVSGHIGAHAVYDIMSLPAWRRGAVCLIGDAAHAVGPHVGQGASLALEDAFVLAKCLRDTSDPTTAFVMFERARRDRVEAIAREARRTGRHKAPLGWIGRKVRDLVLPVFLRKGAEAAAKMYAYRLDWSEPPGAAADV
jgi:2-polyprenyl-6-methoxyphenol hydroxylase-like FAD-dependent oxidoreductase